VRLLDKLSKVVGIGILYIGLVAIVSIARVGGPVDAIAKATPPHGAKDFADKIKFYTRLRRRPHTLLDRETPLLTLAQRKTTHAFYVFLYTFLKYTGFCSRHITCLAICKQLAHQAQRCTRLGDSLTYCLRLRSRILGKT
jgi:hypothetical protein